MPSKCVWEHEKKLDCTIIVISTSMVRRHAKLLSTVLAHDVGPGVQVQVDCRVAECAAA